MQFNVSVQRAIAGDVDVMAGYVGSRGRNLFRWITFMPVVLPIPATAILFVILMNPIFGAFNLALGLVGLPGSKWKSKEVGLTNSGSVLSRLAPLKSSQPFTHAVGSTGEV